MKIGWFDCFSGAGGDMILGALLDAGLPLDALRKALAALDLSGVRVEAERARRGGLAGTRFRVIVGSGDAGHHPPHRGLPDILGLIERSTLDDQVKERASAAFKRLAEAEAAVHGTTVEDVCFHEVGALDAVVDIVGAVAGLKLLQIERVYLSTFRLGSGVVDCAHGRLPVPAPATTELLRGFASEPAGVEGELLTPTAAAVLTTVGEQRPRPPARIERVGYGVGTQDRPTLPNLLRFSIGWVCEAAEADEAWVLETNIDDSTPEVIGYLYDQLFAVGALDVFTCPAQMKKSRPGVLLSVIAAEPAVPAIEQTLFDETSTFGVRRYRVQRRKLTRVMRRLDTPYGPVRMKVGTLDGRVRTVSPEYEDCRALAEQQGVPLSDVLDAATRAARESQDTLDGAEAR